MSAVAMIGTLLGAVVLALHNPWLDSSDPRFGPNCMAVDRFLQDGPVFQGSIEDVKTALTVRDRTWRHKVGQEVLRYANSLHDVAFSQEMETLQPTIDISSVRPVIQALATEQDRAAVEMSAMLDRLGTGPAMARDYAVVDRYEKRRRAIMGPYLPTGPCGFESTPAPKHK